MLLAQTKRRVGIGQAVLRFSLALKGKRLVSPEVKKDKKKKRSFFENTSVVEVKRFCVRCFFFFFRLLLVRSILKTCISGKTDKCLAAFY